MSAPTVVLWFIGGAAVDGERRAGVVAPYAVRGNENVAGRDDRPSASVTVSINRWTYIKRSRKSYDFRDLLCFYSKESGTLCHSDSPPAAAP